MITTVSRADDGNARIRYEFAAGLTDLSPPLEAELVPMVSPTLADRSPCGYLGTRATPDTP